MIWGARETLDRHCSTVFLEVHDEGLPWNVPAETGAILEALDYEIHERESHWRCEPV